MVLDDLVLENTAASLLDGHLGQRDAGLVGCHRGLVEDLVYLLLGVGSKNPLGLAHKLELGLKGFDRIYDFGGGGNGRFLRHTALSFTRSGFTQRLVL